MDNKCSCVVSMTELSMISLLSNQDTLYKVIDSLPVSIHKMLFQFAVGQHTLNDTKRNLSSKLGDCPLLFKDGEALQSTSSSIRLLVMTWPSESLVVRELFDVKHLSSLLNSDTGDSLLHLIMEGLLSLEPLSRLSVVDFSGISLSALFQLPVLSLPLEVRRSPRVLQHISDKCKKFIVEEEHDNLEAVLSWKLSELSEVQVALPERRCARTSPLKIYVDCRLNLTDWIAIDNELIGLVLQDLTPFNICVRSLVLESFHLHQSEQLRWIFSMICSESLNELIFYGSCKSLTLVPWVYSKQLCSLENLETFGLGSMSVRFDLRPGENDPPQCVLQSVRSLLFGSWRHLRELFLVGIPIKSSLEEWLEPVVVPLERISLIACNITRSDIRYLARSKHVQSMVYLSLEKNCFRGAGMELCAMLGHAHRLHSLILRDTALKLHEKVAVISTVQCLPRLDTLSLYEQDDMISTDGYRTLVEMACAVASLRSFYLFPFSYRPFDVFYRQTVLDACYSIMQQNERTDLKLYY